MFLNSFQFDHFNLAYQCYCQKQYICVYIYSAIQGDMLNLGIKNSKSIVGRHIFLSISKRKCFTLMFYCFYEFIRRNYLPFYKLSNNLIYTTGMTLHSSGNSSSQVPLNENGRFIKCFPPPFHHNLFSCTS